MNVRTSGSFADSGVKIGHSWTARGVRALTTPLRGLRNDYDT
ncbi:uncharacterized protein HHUB_3058 [Halobacterium hubeiense]|uniref:Uncharacterized protein n=1 Tax=Halobacterium hubeiense TaxID=1407499 RepID=A0A0U5H618_9EURY|nr:uncharacterized protein HHUB_3058 [Halobacterium hubeiense]